ncbi:hypothetical protein CFP65_6390 [Kitasatospora sp. MMS16-BH015]|uniref:hypothetical protein n=1 Tax=Kitasatospora sp. MMS16-BH015 TaxID=2018025 RepID=UPI000CA139AC|nr:hypothetical protein [Kitasatospora sp. MMS16-BH015]AUG81046.1 hypothetical protein CFP65_6390 [Kitasatospora sp. MMS16-BH015]
MIDNGDLTARDLLGRRLLRVTAAWHHCSADVPSLVHLWLHLEGLGPVLIDTPGTGLVLRGDEPHEPYPISARGRVSVSHDAPEVPLSRYVGQPVRSVREIRATGAAAPVGATLCFAGGGVRLLGLADELVLTEEEPTGELYEDVVLARVVQTCPAAPSQWDAWTTHGQYLHLRYRHGEGSVEQHPSPDVETWDSGESHLITVWEDGTEDCAIALDAFLAEAGLSLAPGAELLGG